MRGALAIATALGLFIALGGAASADLDDYLNNPGYQQSTSVSCNAGHGAFEFYRGLRAGWIPAAARQGGIGDTTGPTNSGFAQFCKTQ